MLRAPPSVPACTLSEASRLSRASPMRTAASARICSRFTITSTWASMRPGPSPPDSPKSLARTKTIGLVASTMLASTLPTPSISKVSTALPDGQELARRRTAGVHEFERESARARARDAGQLELSVHARGAFFHREARVVGLACVRVEYAHGGGSLIHPHQTLIHGEGSDRARNVPAGADVVHGLIRDAHLREGEIHVRIGAFGGCHDRDFAERGNSAAQAVELASVRVGGCRGLSGIWRRARFGLRAGLFRGRRWARLVPPRMKTAGYFLWPISSVVLAPGEGFFAPAPPPSMRAPAPARPPAASIRRSRSVSAHVALKECPVSVFSTLKLPVASEFSIFDIESF